MYIGPQISDKIQRERANAISLLDFSGGVIEDIARDLLADHASGKIVFMPGKGYSFFEDSIWKKDRNEIRIRQLAGDIPRLLKQRAADYFWDPQIQGKFFDAASQYGTAKSRLAVIRAAKHHAKLQFNAKFEGEHPELLSLPNGLFDLGVQRLRSVNPGEHLTLGSPVVLDPQAKCPLWERFIAKITGENTGKMAFLQQVVGSALLNQNGHCVLLQAGDEEARAFMRTISQVLGGYGAIVATRGLFARQSTLPEFSRKIRNRRIIFCESGPVGNRGEQRLLSTLDSAYEAIPYASTRFAIPSIWFLLKNGTCLDTSNERIWKDTQVFSFESLSEETSSFLAKGFREEYSGILNWILEGYRQFKENGCALPPCLVRLKDDIRRVVDPIWYYCNRVCVRSPGLKVGSSDLYEHFRKWCRAFGYPIVSQKGFSMRAQDFFGETKKNGKGNMYFDGIMVSDLKWQEFDVISVPNQSRTEIYEAVSHENTSVTEVGKIVSDDKFRDDWSERKLEVSDNVLTYETCEVQEN